MSEAPIGRPPDEPAAAVTAAGDGPARAQRSREFAVVRVAGGQTTALPDRVAVEEPLEVRLAGDPFAVTMRTPGHDRELVLGLLLSEGIIASAADVGAIAHCGRLGDPGLGNTIDVASAPGTVLCIVHDSPARRGTLTSAACGVCGRRSIDDLLARCGALPVAAQVTLSAVSMAVARLGEVQPVFGATGGTHCAALCTFDGTLVAAFEDVGRHNAVDKVIGSRLLAGALPLAEHILAVSGRASFEIVQKAIAAGIPVVASVSAPSSLAVELARRANVTLAGFVRPTGLNVYACFERVRSGTLLAPSGPGSPDLAASRAAGAESPSKG